MEHGAWSMERRCAGMTLFRISRNQSNYTENFYENQESFHYLIFCDVIFENTFVHFFSFRFLKFCNGTIAKGIDKSL